MAMRHVEGELRETGDPRDVKLADHIAQRLAERGSDLPEVDQGAKRRGAELSSKPDLRQQTLELLPLLVQPTEEEKRKLAEQYGLVFLPMGSESYAQIVARNPAHFLDGELDYANAIPALQDFVPPVAVEVGLKERDLVIRGSFGKSRAWALQKIDEWSQELKLRFPDFRAIMLPAAGFARADEEYAQRNLGKQLFGNYSVWCLDNIFELFAARAGRDNRRARRFYVIDWHVGHGRPFVATVPAVVKIGSR